MTHFKYLIIGGGIAADSAISGIRELDKTGSIGMLCSENKLPYNRPPLSKALWKNEPEDSIIRNTDRQGVVIFFGHTATVIDAMNKKVTDDHGGIHGYDQLLVATGGRVNRPFQADDEVIWYRTFDDYRKLRGLVSEHDDFIVIGGGFIGSEMAAALAMNGKKVTMIVPDDGIGSKVFPRPLSRYLSGYFSEKGVKIISGDRVKEVWKEGRTLKVQTVQGKIIPAGGVVAGTGISPDTALASAAGLRTDNGIVVNEFLQTSVPDIYATGDVANFFSPALEKHIRVEHEDNSLAMGMMAGRNMVGGRDVYHHIPFFYSDLFELGYEAVGDLNASYETVMQWKEEFREGVVYYLDAKRVRGVLLWNTWGQVDQARSLIKEKKEFNAGNVLNRLPA